MGLKFYFMKIYNNFIFCNTTSGADSSFLHTTENTTALSNLKVK